MNPEFEVHVLSKHGLERAVSIAESFDILLKSLMVMCPHCREFSIAKTKLEEACFFAKKAMAISHIK